MRTVEREVGARPREKEERLAKRSGAEKAGLPYAKKHSIEGVSPCCYQVAQATTKKGEIKKRKKIEGRAMKCDEPIERLDPTTDMHVGLGIVSFGRTVAKDIRKGQERGGGA